MTADLWTNGAPACFIGFGPNAVSHYRTVMPANALKASLFLRNDKTLAPIKELGVKEEPVAVYSMPFMEWQIDECEQILGTPQKLIVDVDDYLPAILGKTDMVASDRFTKERIDAHIELLCRADLVTCATEWLADTLSSRHGIETMVCPNALDMERFNIRRFPRRKGLTVVGWSGSGGHKDAYETIVVPAMQKVLEANGQVVFAVLGSPADNYDPRAAFSPEVSERTAAFGFKPIYEHAQVMSQFHIMLAPALDTDFYNGKSPIRYLEAAASYAAVVASDVTYGDVIEDGRDRQSGELPAVLGVDWAEDILKLIADPKGRERMTRRAHAYVSSKHTIAQTVPVWKAAIERALELG